MTVKLLTNYPPYVQGNLFTSDAATEAALIAAKIATATLTGGTSYVAPARAQRGNSRARTAAQLAGAPIAGDISMDSDVYLDTDPTQRYVVNATGTAYVTYGGGGTGAFSGITGQPTDNANLAAALASKMGAAVNWAAAPGGGTPNLTSGTAVLGTSYVNTTAGVTTLSPPIDGITVVEKGDVLACFTAGTYTLIPVGDATRTLSSVTYNGSNQVTGYVANGVSYTVAYPNSTTITVTGGGFTKTITLDGSGRVSGLTTA